MIYKTYGIHTRLHYIVNHAGGIDKAVRRKMFKDKYNFDDETLDIVLMYDIDNLLLSYTIEEIKRSILDKQSRDSIKGKNALRNLTGMTMMLNGDYDNYF